MQHNLVSDLPGLADRVDPDLVNPWGISFSPTSPFWISNNHSGTAKVYDSSGKLAPLVVTVRTPGGGSPSSPTGQVFNATKAFVVSEGKPAVFLFATEDGTISGWYNGVENNNAVIVVNKTASGAVYKGLAIASPDSGPLLFAADFHGGTVDVYKGDFSSSAVAGAFSDPTIPIGFAPFNVYVSGGKVYVAYAKQDDELHDDVPGIGNGFINVFDFSGHLLQRLISGGRLNSPWGMAVAPDGFSDFGKALLVGNFGDGTINAYDLTTGAFLGTLQDSNGKPIVNSGLWGLQFGNGGSGGDANALYFTAGVSGPSGDAIESHGLFGSIQPAPAIRADGVVDGAGFQSMIAPNGWVTIFGKNLAATTRSWADTDFTGNQLPTKLDDVSVSIDGKPSYVAFISPTQLNVLAPGNTAPGPVKIEAKHGDLISASATGQVQPTAPAFFVNDKHAIVTHADSALVNAASPAVPGEIVIFYGTGFGLTNPPSPEGQVPSTSYPLANEAAVLIDRIPAEVVFAGLISPGLYQLNVRLPSGVSSGDVVVTAEVGGARSPDGVLVSTKADPVQPPQTYSVGIDNFAFLPPVINVNPGGELTWTNKQGVEHTVVSDNGKFASTVLAQNATFSVKLSEPGTYAYHCSIHPFMKGQVVVQK